MKQNIVSMATVWHISKDGGRWIIYGKRIKYLRPKRIRLRYLRKAGPCYRCESL